MIYSLNVYQYFVKERNLKCSCIFKKLYDIGTCKRLIDGPMPITCNLLKLQLHFQLRSLQNIKCNCNSTKCILLVLKKFIDGLMPIPFNAFDLSSWTLICEVQQDRATFQIIWWSSNGAQSMYLAASPKSPSLVSKHHRSSGRIFNLFYYLKPTGYPSTGKIFVSNA